MLVRALGLRENAAAAEKFHDVSAADWFAGAVGAAAQLSIASGRGDGTFGAKETITREQLAVLVSNALDFAASSGLNIAVGEPLSPPASFADAEQISKWAAAFGRTPVAIPGDAGNQRRPFLPAGQGGPGAGCCGYTKNAAYTRLD